MKILSVVGARPQFVKAAALSRKLRQEHDEILLHTGQHYDYKMSGVFFEGLDLPEPNINLEVGSGSHGRQTAAMLDGIERALQQEQPDRVIIYGDTNSTLAGALAASKLHIPLVHIEAGLRSFNREMPEEINRIVADHLSQMLLCPSETAVVNLKAEGIRNGVYLVGDVMLDVLMWARPMSTSNEQGLLGRFGITKGAYLAATVHRSENTDTGNLISIMSALNELDEKIVLPLHPRTRKAIRATGIELKKHVSLVDPIGYIDMISLLGAARMVLTDSGGLQKEAYWLGVPCVTFRRETEWVETATSGWNRLVGASTVDIVAAVGSFLPPSQRPRLYGDGRASDKCVELLSSREPSGALSLHFPNACAQFFR